MEELNLNETQILFVLIVSLILLTYFCIKHDIIKDLKILFGGKKDD